MFSNLKASHAPRYASLARLLLKHREAAMAAGAELGPGDESGGPSAEDAEELVRELQAMGPTFVKLGQLLSTRADLLPAVYLEELSRLRDDVEPLPPGVAEGVIEEELGVRVSTAFGSFQARPIGAASLGQVHRATLRDGRPVAVKVQRPGIRRQALDDMEVIAELAAFVDEHSPAAARVGFSPMVEEFRRSLMGELDYRREAGNLRLLKEQLAGFTGIVVPEPVDDYTSSRVLTMDYVGGRSVSSIGPLGRLDLDCSKLAEELIGAYLEQVLVHGFFHADPHPGNVLLTDDGRLALVDLGMVARLSPGSQEWLLRLLLAVSGGDGTEAAEALEHLGTPLDGYDPDGLRTRVSELVLRARGATMADLQAGRLLGALAMAASSSGLRPRRELTLLAKAMLNLEEVARTLDPDFQPDAAIRAHATRIMRRRMLDSASPAHLLTAALDAADFAEHLPARMNKVMEALAEGKFSLSVEGLNEAALMRGAQKVANRLATGTFIAAMVIAAGLFSSSRGGGSVWGYPVLSIVFLGLAALAALWLVAGVIRSDLPQRRRRK